MRFVTGSVSNVHIFNHNSFKGQFNNPFNVLGRVVIIVFNPPKSIVGRGESGGEKVEGRKWRGESGGEKVEGDLDRFIPFP
jgi:hypothetical protein